MTTATPVYGTIVTHTIGLSTGPLASDTNLLAGRAGTAIDQKDTDDAVDALVGGLVTTGTSPTASRQIEIWLYASADDSNFNEGITGTDANKTLVTKSHLRLLTIIPTSNTSDIAHYWGPFSVAQAYGGIIPVRWGVFVVHNTGVALNSTGGNHFVKHYPVKFESA
jgi:hypothetical protein